mgnify:FL=1
MELNPIYVSIIQFVVTSAFFFVEAILHYNMGKYGKTAFTVPPFKKSMHLLGIILFFAALSSGVTYLIEITLL